MGEGKTSLVIPKEPPLHLCTPHRPLPYALPNIAGSGPDIVTAPEGAASVHHLDGDSDASLCHVLEALPVLYPSSPNWPHRIDV